MNEPKPAALGRAYAWDLLAALTCPCHLPVLALLLALAGTAFLNYSVL